MYRSSTFRFDPHLALTPTLNHHNPNFTSDTALISRPASATPLNFNVCSKYDQTSNGNLATTSHLVVNLRHLRTISRLWQTYSDFWTAVSTSTPSAQQRPEPWIHHEKANAGNWTHREKNRRRQHNRPFAEKRHLKLHPKLRPRLS
jgi:hypothetical protein